jgi:hypothetical protein
VIAKPISIKGTGGESGGCAMKGVDLTSGDPHRKLGAGSCTAIQQAVEHVGAGSLAQDRWRRIVSDIGSPPHSQTLIADLLHM